MNRRFEFTRMRSKNSHLVAAMATVIALAICTSALAEPVPERIGQYAGHIFYNIRTGESSPDCGGFSTRAFQDVYSNTTSGANFGFSSTDLNSTWGDRVTTIDTGILEENDFTIFNSGTSAGPLLTATVNIKIYLGTTPIPPTTPIGQYTTGTINFGAGGLPAGFYTIVTVTGLSTLATPITLTSTDLLITQQVATHTGTASRLGIASLDPVTIGSSANTMYINSATVGAPGYYNIGNPPLNANPGYRIAKFVCPAGLTPTTLPDGQANVAYGPVTITGTGGTGPYTVALASGSSMPPGMTFTPGASSADIGGTPTTAGTYNFTVNVTDTGGTPVCTSAVPYTLLINPPAGQGSCYTPHSPCTCSVTTQAACTAAGGCYGGDGNACGSASACNPAVTCCKGDVNADGFVDGDDVRPFVRGLFPNQAGTANCRTATFCAIDMNSDNTLDGTDVSLFVGALLAGNNCPVNFACDNGVGSHCQITDRMPHGTAGILAVTSDSAQNGGNGFFAADDFRVTVAGSISQVCWTGIYVSSTGTDCSAGAVDSFRIVYYNSDTPDGRPGSIKAGPFTQSAATLTSVTKNPTGNLVNNTFNEIQYRAVHAPVPVAADECLWIEISNTGSATCRWLWQTAPGNNSHSLQDVNSTPGAQYSDAAPCNDFDLAFCVNVLIDNNGIGCFIPPPPPTNDECGGATPIACGQTNTYLICQYTSGGTGNDPTSSCELAGGGPFAHDSSLWFDFTATGPTATITLCGTGSDNDDSVVTIFQTGAPCPPTAANELACDDDACTLPAFGASIVHAAGLVGGQHYLILVNYYSGGHGNGPNTIRITCP